MSNHLVRTARTVSYYTSGPLNFSAQVRAVLHACAWLVGLTTPTVPQQFAIPFAKGAPDERSMQVSSYFALAGPQAEPVSMAAWFQPDATAHAAFPATWEEAPRPVTAAATGGGGSDRDVTGAQPTAPVARQCPPAWCHLRSRRRQPGTRPTRGSRRHLRERQKGSRRRLRLRLPMARDRRPAPSRRRHRSGNHGRSRHHPSDSRRQQWRAALASASAPVTVR